MDLNENSKLLIEEHWIDNEVKSMGIEWSKEEEIR